MRHHDIIETALFHTITEENKRSWLSVIKVFLSGVHPSLYLNRIRRGMDIKDAAGPPLKDKDRPDVQLKHMIKAMDNGVTPQKFTSDLKIMSADRAANPDLNKGSGKDALTSKERSYMKACGISYTLFTQRRSRGWRHEEAVYTPPGEDRNAFIAKEAARNFKTHAKNVPHNKFTIKELTSMQEAGVSLRLYSQRRWHGWSRKDAINTPPRVKRKNIK